MKFVIKKAGIDTYKESVAFVNRGHTICPHAGLHPLDRVEISRGRRTVLAVLNATEEMVELNQIALCDYGFDKLGIPDGSLVDVTPAPPPSSLALLQKKIGGARLSSRDMLQIVRDITEGRYSKVELTAFVTACTINALSDEEVVSLTEAMISTGERLTFPSDVVADKHCIGGVPGNRTSPIVVSIAAACGVLIPKTSSRSITSPAGTADTMEVLTNVEIPLSKMRRVVRKEHGCFVWGGSLSLSPADDIIIGVEKPLNIDSEGQMIASILSKKVAAGSNHILIDIPIGEEVKATSHDDSERLKNRFERVGKKLGVNVTCVVTDGTQPVGNGVGPLLEARDVMKVLRNDSHAPSDLREKGLQLSGRLLEFVGASKQGQGYHKAKRVLESGRALAKLESIRRLQGRREMPELSRHYRDARSKTSGVIKAISNMKIARLAKLAGAPKNAVGGVYLNKKVGDLVEKRQSLFRVYANNRVLLDFAWRYWLSNQDIYRIES